MELTVNEAEAYVVGKKGGKEEKDVYLKYKDRHISCTYILDNTRQGYNTGQKN